jgi:hypothetical protein
MLIRQSAAGDFDGILGINNDAAVAWRQGLAATDVLVCDHATLTVESGQSYRDVLQFWASDRGHSGWPELMIDSIEGVFRLRWDFVEGTDASAKDARKVGSTSNEFRMVLSKQ